MVTGRNLGRFVVDSLDRRDGVQLLRILEIRVCLALVAQLINLGWSDEESGREASLIANATCHPRG